MQLTVRYLTLVLVAPAAAGAQGGPGAAVKANRPTTVAAAVTELRTKWLDSSARDWILRNPKKVAVTRLYMPFGTGVRNAWGLWGDNAALRESCGDRNPEDCSAVIFRALWDTLRAEADPRLVASLDCQFALYDLLMIRYRGFAERRIGEVLQSLQAQIDSQAPQLAPRLPAGCASRLQLRPIKGPRPNCWVRAEFSEDGHDPVSLDAFLGWFSWRNAFDTRHTPPYLELTFRDPCAWPQRPTWFRPERPPP